MIASASIRSLINGVVSALSVNPNVLDVRKEVSARLPGSGGATAPVDQLPKIAEVSLKLPTGTPTAGLNVELDTRPRPQRNHHPQPPGETIGVPASPTCPGSLPSSTTTIRLPDTAPHPNP